MSRYATDIVLLSGMALVVWIVAATVSVIIWRIALEHGGPYAMIKKAHNWCIVMLPTALIVYNLISRSTAEPHTTLLWAYFIMPLATTLPFLASLAGLCHAKKQRKGEQAGS